MLLGKHRADEPHHRVAVREDRGDVDAAADPLVQPLPRIVRPDPSWTILKMMRCACPTRRSTGRCSCRPEGRCARSSRLDYGPHERSAGQTGTPTWGAPARHYDDDPPESGRSRGPGRVDCDQHHSGEPNATHRRELGQITPQQRYCHWRKVGRPPGSTRTWNALGRHRRIAAAVLSWLVWPAGSLSRPGRSGC